MTIAIPQLPENLVSPDPREAADLEALAPFSAFGRA